MQHFFEIKELSNSLDEDKVYVYAYLCIYVCVHKYNIMYVLYVRMYVSGLKLGQQH